MSTAARIAENLAAVQGRIGEAARRSGRDASAVRLVAVTKYVGTDAARSLVDAGCRDLGESRPQELWSKVESVGNCGVRWHLVGHLQRNKVQRTLPLVEWIHSADSLRLLKALNEQSEKKRLRPHVLLEVNTSGDEAKHGFAPNELQALVPRLTEFSQLRICGLMTMAALAGGLDAARRNFAALREQREQLRRTCPDGVTLDELSMGMSQDYEVAVEEGATIVRIGSALFEGVDRP